MQYHIQTLVKHLFEKDSFEQVTVQELKQFTEAYPYAAVGQYLYAKKLYDARSWNYYEQTEQASLYFHNPLWYRWLMDQKHETPVLMPRQEETAQQNAFRDRVVVQMPKGSSPVTNLPKEEVKEPVEETVAADNHTASVGESETIKLTAVTQEQLPDWKDIDDMPITTASIQPEEAATHLQEFLPEINTQEPLQADTEAFGFVQADGTPLAEYTETVTDNTTEQEQPVQSVPEAETPVYTEEHELTIHEFQPAADAAPIQADTEAFGDIQEKDTTETYTETVTHNTEEGYQAYTEETAPAIENIAGIPAAKEEVEATPEFFAEVAAAQDEPSTVQEEAFTASAVAIAESSVLAEEQHTAESGELSETIEAPAAYEAQETTEAPAETIAPAEATESPVALETTELAAAAETAEAPAATGPEQWQETQAVTESADQPVAAAPVADYQEDDVQPGGDLPPYQLLDNTTEIPAAEAEAIEQKIDQEPITGEPAHEGPVNIEFVEDEPVTETIAQLASISEPAVQEEHAGEYATQESEPENHEPIQEEAVTEHAEPVQHEQSVAEEPVVTEMAAQEEHPVELNVPEEPAGESVTYEQEPVNNEPVQEEVVTEPVAESPSAAEGLPQEQLEPVTREQEPEQVNNEPGTQDPELVTPEPIQWKAEPVFTPANTEPKIAINTEEPIFESYHTIDYFASQGIKLGQEDFKDRLGKQLKSFTEWLRSMKRIVPTEATASLDEVTSQSIQRIAEHSVEEKEVITEAMAEVWAKQGHPEKAISVYEKLSLLNPAKSPYFAGRIEQLKAL
jgi:hypothetical protein